MIGIIDYGLGNLSSVFNALKKIKFDAEIFSEPKKINNYSRIILPGVGSFKKGMNNLTENNWDFEIKKYVSTGKPLLGICLGMQLLFSEGEEEGFSNGLGIIDGKVKMQTNRSYKIPHVDGIFKNFKITSYIKIQTKYRFLFCSFIFVYSRQRRPLAYFEYDKNFVASIAKENVVGTQFHPEKSLPSGLKILKNFAEWRI